MDGPVFGVRIPGCSYVVRPSAYALVHGEGDLLAVVRTRRGWFLPGGGIDGDEGPERAAERETREECGLLVASRGIVGTATEIVHSPAGHSGVDKLSTFIDAVVLGVAAATELDHELVWLSHDEAIACLSHHSHRWAVTLRPK